MSYSSNDSAHDALIEKTRLIWSKRAGREISTEKAEEISQRMYEFISILVRQRSMTPSQLWVQQFSLGITRILIKEVPAGKLRGAF